MTVLNPPIMIQALATHNADDLRSALFASMLGLGLGQNPRPRQGIIPGYGKELSVAASGVPAMNVVVGSGAIALPAPTNGHGGWFCVNDGDLTKTIAASNPTNPRTDLVIARVADAQYTGGGDNLADIEVITGTAGVGAPVPTVPTAKGVYQVLAQVAVAAAATSVTNANITLNTAVSRPYTVAAGGILPVANTAARTALAPYVGMAVVQVDDGTIWEFFNAAWVKVADAGAWTPYPPTIRQGGIALGVGADATRFKVNGRTCTVHYNFQPNAVGAAPNDVDLSLPVLPSASAFTDGCGTMYMNDASIPTLYKLAVRTHPTDASKVKFSDTSFASYFGTVPSVALAVNDTFLGTLVYEF
jgi:hypothetical protein